MDARPGKQQRSSAPADISIRPFRVEDETDVIGLLTSALGWEEDKRHTELFRWKHRSNPFGPSPAWLAEDDQGVVGFRAFMRWEFLKDGTPISAVRAVDTATHPRAQGKGVFRSLTMKGIEELTKAGVAWVFNTPNDKSAPGYLSMGWQQVGHLPTALRPARISALPKLLSRRAPADLWSADTSVGEEASLAFGDLAGTKELLDVLNRSGRGIRTRLTPDYLRWRYGQGPVGYRVLRCGRNTSDGLVVFRVRKRGRLIEALVADLLVPHSSRKRRSRLLAEVGEMTRADYTVLIGRAHPSTWLRVPRAGPLLTWRPLVWSYGKPQPSQWELSAGDVELF